MKTITLTAPAHWASAIINGDYSGMTEQDREELAEWARSNAVDPAHALTVDEPYVGRFEGLICGVADYVFPARGGRPAIRG